MIVEHHIHIYKNVNLQAWNKATLGVLQDSVLGPLLFSIYLNDLFMFLEVAKICNYATDTTIHVCGPKIETVL